jgi:preprotein translocase subunit YajC
MLSNSYVAMLALGGPPAGASPEEQKKAMFMQLGMMVFFGIIFYVMLIRPQQKRAKEQSKMLNELKAGDKVTTTSGIVGVVVGIKDNSVTLRSGESKLEITKAAIGEVIPGTTAS